MEEGASTAEHRERGKPGPDGIIWSAGSSLASCGLLQFSETIRSLHCYSLFEFSAPRNILRVTECQLPTQHPLSPFSFLTETLFFRCPILVYPIWLRGIPSASGVNLIGLRVISPPPLSVIGCEKSCDPFLANDMWWEGCWCHLGKFCLAFKSKLFSLSIIEWRQMNPPLSLGQLKKMKPTMWIAKPRTVENLSSR